MKRRDNSYFYREIYYSCIAASASRWRSDAARPGNDDLSRRVRMKTSLRSDSAAPVKPRRSTAPRRDRAGAAPAAGRSARRYPGRSSPRAGHHRSPDGPAGPDRALGKAPAAENRRSIPAQGKRGRNPVQVGQPAVIVIKRSSDPGHDGGSPGTARRRGTRRTRCSMQRAFQSIGTMFRMFAR